MDGSSAPIDWAVIWSEYGDLMLRVAHQVLRGRNPDGKSAEDVVGDVVAELMRTGALDGKKNVPGVLVTAVRWRCLDALRRGKKQGPVDEIELVQVSGSDTEAQAFEQITNDTLADIIHRLSRAQQQVIRERIMKARPAKDVAADMGITPQRVSQIVKEALAAIRADPAFISMASTDSNVPVTTQKDSAS